MTADSKSPPGACQINVSRRGSVFTDVLRHYRIIIDQQTVGRIGPGQDLTFPVAPGGHSLRLKVDWAGSPTIEVDLMPGETASFECAGTNLFRKIVANLFLWLSLIVLRRMDDPSMLRSS